MIKIYLIKSDEYGKGICFDDIIYKDVNIFWIKENLVDNNELLNLEFDDIKSRLTVYYNHLFKCGIIRNFNSEYFAYSNYYHDYEEEGREYFYSKVIKATILHEIIIK